MRIGRIALAFLVTAATATPQPPSFRQAQSLLSTHCFRCHSGDSPAGGFDVRQTGAEADFQTNAALWNRIAARLKSGEMPPKGVAGPDANDRDAFLKWVESSQKAEACGPVPVRIRRLTRDEYSSTINDLLQVHLDLGHALPAEGSGGEGFDNAGETLVMSPLLTEKLMEAAKIAVDYASKEYKSRTDLLIAAPGAGGAPEKAAHDILAAFLPRAFRRPVTERDLAPYMALFGKARGSGMAFEPSVFFAVRGILVSPGFLFHAGQQDSFALASRLSYFLWGSMPDELLLDLAAQNRLRDPGVLKTVIGLMLRNDRSLDFTQRFMEQWLRTRDLGAEKTPDPVLFPAYAASDELRADIRFEPILFFRELILQNLSLLNLIDSKYGIVSKNLLKVYNFKVEPAATQQPQFYELPAGTHRGGLLGMAAVLAVSSYPHRTSPVLRGAWILETLLGTPPPPPPPNVPSLPEPAPGAAPVTVRERLARHRADPVCASCHSRIDPLGFALENFDAIGAWRTEEAGGKVDSSGQLPDGTKFDGPEQFKAALLKNKGLFIRNLTRKMLGYALNRGLTAADSCTVDSIVTELAKNDYRAQTLIEQIVLSDAFRHSAAAHKEPGKL